MQEAAVTEAMKFVRESSQDESSSYRLIWSRDLIISMMMTSMQTLLSLKDTSPYMEVGECVTNHTHLNSSSTL